jgi:hypothetical protein
MLVVTLLAGLSIGALSAWSRVPDERVLPTLASMLLSLVAASGVVMLDGGLLEAMTLVVATGVSSVLSASIWWHQRGALPLTFGAIVAYELRHPRFLRELFAELHGRRGSMTEV